MEFDRLLAEEIAKDSSGVKILPKYVVGTISPDIEWIKWLSYVPEFEKKRIEYFDSKKISELSLEELEEAKRYNRNKIFARLIKIYGTSECSKEDYMRVYDYMCNESIEELMLSKLTSEELRYAKNAIFRLSKAPNEQLSVKVKEEIIPEKYEQLSMVDSYILHLISKINYGRAIANLERKIKAELEKNEIMRQRSSYYAENRKYK